MDGRVLAGLASVVVVGGLVAAIGDSGYKSPAQKRLDLRCAIVPNTGAVRARIKRCKQSKECWGADPDKLIYSCDRTLIKVCFDPEALGKDPDELNGVAGIQILTHAQALALVRSNAWVCDPEMQTE